MKNPKQNKDEKREQTIRQLVSKLRALDEKVAALQGGGGDPFPFKSQLKALKEEVAALQRGGGGDPFPFVVRLKALEEEVEAFQKEKGGGGEPLPLKK